MGIIQHFAGLNLGLKLFLLPFIIMGGILSGLLWVATIYLLWTWREEILMLILMLMLSPLLIFLLPLYVIDKYLNKSFIMNDFKANFGNAHRGRHPAK